ncbi:MAG: hypothetical protein WAN86_05235 [Hyphomicrobiaceae bacterium]
MAVRSTCHGREKIARSMFGPAVPDRSPSLKRRHKVPGRGTRQFAPAVVFGELGVVRLTTPRRRGP